VFISIEGCIGSGKTTTARIVAEQLSYLALPEETAHHPFLADFYSNPSLYALETELGFVLLHYHRLKMVHDRTAVVSDFSPGKDLVFAKMNLDGADLALFEYVYKDLSTRLVRPQIAVFLDLPIDVLMERIQRRGRPYEQGVPASYLERLRDMYFTHFNDLADVVELVKLTQSDSREEVAEKALISIKSHL
jgi:deoxyguanosine kinase